MERQNILLVIIFVSLLCVVIIVGGLIIFRPTAAADKTETGTPGELPLLGANFDPTEYLRTDKEPPGLEEETEEEKPESNELIVKLSGEEKPEVEIVPDSEDLKTEKVEPVPLKEIEEKKPEPTTPPVSKPVTRKKPVPQATRKAPVTKPQPPRGTEYWIQVASYKSRDRAEIMNRKLTSEGISSRVTTCLVKGENYFRVRIGPYIHKAEADKFLVMIKKIQGLESSFVSRVSYSS